MDADNWWRQAACSRLPTNLFYDYEKDQTRRVPQEVKDACESCLVRAECLIYALEYPELHGYWGGKTAGERRRIRLTLNIIPG